MGRLRPVRGLGTAVAVLLGTFAVAQLPIIAFGWQRLAELQDGLADGRGTGMIGTGSLALQLEVTGAVLLGGIGAVALFLVWVWRTRSNAGVLSPGYPFRFTPRFSVGGLLVPIASLWWCRGILDDIHAASRPGGTPGRNPLVRAWWWAVVAALVLQVLAVTAFSGYSTVVIDPGTGRSVEGAEEAVRSFRDAALAGTVDGLVTATGMVLLALFVMQVTRLQSGRAAPVTTDPSR